MLQCCAQEWFRVWKREKTEAHIPVIDLLGLRWKLASMSFECKNRLPHLEIRAFEHFLFPCSTWMSTPGLRILPREARINNTLSECHFFQEFLFVPLKCIFIFPYPLFQGVRKYGPLGPWNLLVLPLTPGGLFHWSMVATLQAPQPLGENIQHQINRNHRSNFPYPVPPGVGMPEGVRIKIIVLFREVNKKRPELIICKTIYICTEYFCCCYERNY